MTANEPTPVRAVEPDQPSNWFTRRRLAKWNAPRRPRSWRWAISVIGRVLIATGVLLFGFVAYQLWGTGLETARAQRALATEFDELLRTATTTTEPTTEPTTAPTTEPDDPEPDDSEPDEPEPDEPEPTDPDPVEPEPEPEPGVDQQIPPIEQGDPLALLEIPSIDVEDIVVAGVGVGDLQRGPGHFPETPLPGQLGNAALAGHRTTYGQPFRDVDQLQPGDEIIVTTIAGRFVYHVTGTQIVAPSDYQVVATTRPDVAEITLVSCHPVWSAAQRIIISGELVEELSDPVGRPIRYGLDDGTVELPGEDFEPSGTEPTVPATPVTTQAPPSTTAEPTPGTTSPETTTRDTTTPETSAPAASVPAGGSGGGSPPAADPLASSVEDTFGRGWFHDRDAWPHIALWGLVLILISVASYFLSRLLKRDLVGAVAGVAPFAIAAFFFFQNVNRLLPPSL